MRKFDLSLRSSRSSYFATFRHQLTILSKTDALDEEKWLNMLGTFVKDWFRDRKSGSAGMPRPISYAVFCLKKKKNYTNLPILPLSSPSNHCLPTPVAAPCCHPAFLLPAFFFEGDGDPRDLHSFPTRRSSDLAREALTLRPFAIN